MRDLQSTAAAEHALLAKLARARLNGDRYVRVTGLEIHEADVRLGERPSAYAWIPGIDGMPPPCGARAWVYDRDEELWCLLDWEHEDHEGKHGWESEYGIWHRATDGDEGAGA